MVNKRVLLSTAILLCGVFSTLAAKTVDPYKVLGVEKNASQREIQKAFHKLSLQYHPDKNKAKDAQEKFAQINNAYDILSDEEKRKNYDLYGDEKGSPGFGAGYPEDQGGNTYYTSGGQGQHGFNFQPGGWQDKGGSQSFSYSFGGPSSQNSFGFDMSDIFSNLFGGNSGGSHFGGFGGSTRSRPQSGFQSGSRSSPESMKSINSEVFKKEMADQGMTWVLVFHTPSVRGSQYYESIVQEAADSLQGALKAGTVDCGTEMSFCKEVGIYPRQAPRVFVYSFKASDKGSFVEFSGDLTSKNLKAFCQDHMPRFSNRINLKQVDSFDSGMEKLPRVLLLSTKKDTPVIWRVLSGLHHKRLTFNDVEVHDVTDPRIKKLGVNALPAIVGWLSNGERQVLKNGISVKDLKSAVRDLSYSLDGFERKNKKIPSSHAGKAHEDTIGKVPLLNGLNFDDLCGETKSVCIIGGFRSSKDREKLESILSTVSQKSLRRYNPAYSSGDSISYSLLDVARQPAFLNAFDKSGFKSSDKLLLAYKPRKGKFAAFRGAMTAEEVEGFIVSVLNGDVQFTKTRQKPVVK